MKTLGMAICWAFRSTPLGTPNRHTIARTTVRKNQWVRKEIRIDWKNLIESTDLNASFQSSRRKKGSYRTVQSEQEMLDRIISHSCLTLLLDTLVAHSSKTLSLKHSCKTLLLDTLPWHIWNTSHYYFVLRSVHTAPHSITLYCKSCTD